MIEDSPRFLIHDSLMFADVDERQVAMALQLAEKEFQRKKFPIHLHDEQRQHSFFRIQ